MPGAMKPIGSTWTARFFNSPFILAYSRSISAGRHCRRVLAALADRDQAGAANDVFQIRTGETVGLGGDPVQIDVVRKRHSGGVDLEDVFAAGLVRCADIDQFVETAGPQQCRIDQRRPVGGADQNHGLQLFHAVHFGQDRIDDAGRDLRFANTSSGAAGGNEAVNLVDKDHAGRHLPRTGEQARDLLLALTVPFRKQVGGLDRNEIGFGLARDSLGQQGLAGPRRAIEQETLGRADTQAVEGFRVLQRKLNPFLQLELRVVDAADIGPADIGHLHHDFAHGRRLNPLQRFDEVLARD